MRKFLLPVINIVNLILLGIAFGLGGNTAIYTPAGTERTSLGNYYQVIWNNPTVMSVVTFFLFVTGVALCLFTLIPFKGRKFVALICGGMLIASGVLTLTLGGSLANPVLGYTNSGSLIALVVLLIVAGALEAIMSVYEICLIKKED